MSFVGSGFVVLHRQLLEWEWYQDVHVKTLFLHLLLTVNWKGKRYQGREISRGSRVATLAQLSEETGLSVRTLRTCISKLKATNEIEVSSNTKYSIFTIVNYSLYQDKNSENSTDRQTTDMPATNQRQTSDTPSYNVEQSNNVTSKQDILILPAPIPDGDSLGQEEEKLQVFMSLTLNTGELHPVTFGEIEIWQDLYPNVDIRQEIRNMQGWLLGNGKKRKTRQGIGRFIQSWLAKAQDKNPQAHFAAGQRVNNWQKPSGEAVIQQNFETSMRVLEQRKRERENART